MEILLDMDGVIADFLSLTLAKLNAATGKTITAAEYAAFGVWEIAKVYGVSSSRMWEIIEADGEHWSRLKPFLWAADLLDFVRSLGRVTIATTPSRSPVCAAQKMEWLMQHFSIKNAEVMCGGRKELMGRPGNVLVDDMPKNVERFNKAGGLGILVPSTWNTYPLSFEVVVAAIKVGLS